MVKEENTACTISLSLKGTPQWWLMRACRSRAYKDLSLFHSGELDTSGPTVQHPRIGIVKVQNK